MYGACLVLVRCFFRVSYGAICLLCLFHFAGNTANLMYDDTLLVDISIDVSKPSSIFDEHGEYEILQEAMEEGLRMSG